MLKGLAKRENKIKISDYKCSHTSYNDEPDGKRGFKNLKRALISNLMAVCFIIRI